MASVLVGSAGCSTPQLEGEASLQAADALFTAVTSQRANLLDQAAADLERLHASGEISDDCHQVLAGVVEQARAGEWRPAAKRLRNFIEGQRRG